MRQGIFDSDFIFENDEFKGICLGYDYCAEHEQGIEDIEKSFDMKLSDDSFLGIEARRLRKLPLYLKYVENTYKNRCYSHLIFKRDSVINFSDNTSTCPVGNFKHGIDFVTAWSSRSFGVSLKGKNNPKKKLLELLYNKILDKDVALCFVSKNQKPNPFSRTSPYLAIISRMSEEFLQDMHDYDLDCLNLKNESKKTGIEDYLKKFNKSYFALNPQWNDNSKTTSYNVIYYLQPFNSSLYNSGWFTVEDLRMWAHDVGDVMKNISSNSKDFIFRD
jgi:hypothetical protein